MKSFKASEGLKFSNKMINIATATQTKIFKENTLSGVHFRSGMNIDQAANPIAE